MAQSPAKVEDLGPLKVEDLGPIAGSTEGPNIPKRLLEARNRIQKAKQNQPVRELAIGAAKGAGSTAFTLGKATRDYTPVGRLSDKILPGAFDRRPAELDATNNWQAVGKAGEQIAEFFIPSGIVGRVEAASIGFLPRMYRGSRWALAIARGVPEAASAFGVSKAQGDPNAKGSAALAGATGAAGTVVRGLGPAIERSAEKSVTRAFQATSAHMRALAKKVAPDLLSGRFGRVGGITLDGVAERAGTIANQVGDAIEQQIAQYGHLDFNAMVTGMNQALENAKDAYRVVVPALTGQQPFQVIAFDARKLTQLTRVQRTLDDLQVHGAATLDNLIGVRRAWDEVVANVGGFAERGSSGTRAAASSLKAKAEAWAKREGVRSIRKVLSDPQFVDLKKLRALNAQYSFWTNIQDLAEGGAAKGNDQAGRVIKALGAVTGAIVGEQAGSRYTQGGTGGSIAGAALGAIAGGTTVGGVLGRQIVAASRSPAFRLASAKVKHQIAEAIMNGRVEAAMQMLAPFIGGAAAGTPPTAKESQPATRTPAQGPPATGANGRPRAENEPQSSKARLDNVMSALRNAEHIGSDPLGRDNLSLGMMPVPDPEDLKLLAFLPKQLPKLTAVAKQVLRRVDHLGFDTLNEAMSAVRQHPDWAERWNVTGIERDILERWRTAHLLEHPPKESIWEEISRSIRGARRKMDAAEVKKARDAMTIVPK